MEVSDMEDLVRRMRADVDRREADNRVYLSETGRLEEDLRKAVSSAGVVKDALKAVEGISGKRREGFKGVIEGLVTKALRDIYGESMRFLLRYSEKGSRSCLDMLVEKVIPAGLVVRDMDGFGGGVSDCVGVGLRLLVLKGSPGVDPILVLDEALKGVDAERQIKAGEFLSAVAESLGIQILAGTHSERIAGRAGKVFRVVEDGGRAVLDG